MVKIPTKSYNNSILNYQGEDYVIIPKLFQEEKE